jgi:hypothetical protein
MREKTMKTALTMLAALMASYAIAEEWAFTKKPVATKVGDKVKIEFTVSRETDVAVFIEDTQGRIVRHLVAGVLGENPPTPLKPGLAQTIEWDGKADYGKLGGDGPFQVRVALGLRAKYDRVLSGRPLSFAGETSLGVAPDGTVYVRHHSQDAVYRHAQIVVLNRDGSYRRTLMPFPSTTGGQEGRGLDVMELGGRLVPVKSCASDVASWGGPLHTSMAVSPDGKHLYALGWKDRKSAGGAILQLATKLGDAEGHRMVSLKTIKGAGNVPREGFAHASWLALSSDGKSLFFNGLKKNEWDGSGNAPGGGGGAVYRTQLPQCEEMQVFFGEPGKRGSDQRHLGLMPAGLASDGRGNLLITDPDNKRVVVVSESEGKYQGEFMVEWPKMHSLAVDRKSGAVYACWDKGVIKYSGWKDARKVAQIPFRTKGWEVSTSIAVDSSASSTVVWIAWGDAGQLVRVEDHGDRFEVNEVSPGWRDGAPDECYVGMVVDRLTKEVYVRNGYYGGRLERHDDATGKMEVIHPAGAAGNGQGWGYQYTPAPNGNLYGLCWEKTFIQWDRHGKPVPWTEPRVPTQADLKHFDDKKASTKAHVAFVPVAMCAQPHTLGVRWSDGHLFVIEPLSRHWGIGGRTMKAMHEYLPSGKRITTDASPVLWKVSDAAIGPKFDAAGNIYISEAVRPKGWHYPPEIQKHLDGKGLKGVQKDFIQLYGSIVKFSPKGGMVHWESRKGYDLPPVYGPDPFDGPPKLDPTIKTFDAECYGYGQVFPVKVSAEWIHPGMGNAGTLLFACNCENPTFDVDEFGRVFFPDLPLFRVRVIDTAGNAITHFGAYGNPENCGPDSPVLDPKTGHLRARSADDPRDLKSPFSEPEIALAHPVSVGVTDEHAYIGDATNRRLLRVELVYAAEEWCKAP